MDLIYPSLPIIFTFLVFIFFLFRIWSKSFVRTSAPNLPPGPSKLPLIGSLHHLIRGLPHHILGDLAKVYGPLMHLQVGEVRNIVISSPETAKEVMKTHDLIFAQRPTLHAVQIIMYNSKDIAFAPYGDYWRQLRKICILELLSAKRVQSFRSIREEEVLKFARSVANSAGSLLNFSGMVNSLIYCIISRAAFGKVWKGQEVFLPLVKEIIKESGGFSLADVYPSITWLHLMTGMRHRLEKLHKQFDNLLENIINEHKAKNAAMMTGADDGEERDFVDVLLNLQEQGDLEIPLEDDNLKAIILDIFMAGSETSSTTIEWAMSEIVKHPTVLEKAQTEVRKVFAIKGYVDETGLHELNYLKSIIKETLRLHPPFPLLLPRQSSVECKINGYDIPVKSKVIVNVSAIGRDPNYWREPDKFYPDRFFDSSVDYKGTDFQFIPFGAGRRICPGISFGLANVELPLAHVLYHFDWKLPNNLKPANLDMSEVFGAIVKRESDLCLIPIQRFPLPVD